MVPFGVRSPCLGAGERPFAGDLGDMVVESQDGKLLCEWWGRVFW